MTGDDRPEQTLLGAHAQPAQDPGALPQPDQARAAKVGAVPAAIEAAIDDYAAGLAAEPEPVQESLFGGPVRHVADTMRQASGRGGRKPGSQNKSNQLFRDAMLKMGYRHPGENLMALANADPVELARELGEVATDAKGRVLRDAMGNPIIVPNDPAKIIDVIRKANADLMPYFESKRPTEVHVEKRELGVFRFVEHRQVTRRAGDTIDLTSAPDPSEQNQGLSGDDAVRHDAAKPHGDGDDGASN